MTSKVRVIKSDYWLYIEGIEEDGLHIEIHNSFYSIHDFWINKSGSNFYIYKYKNYFSDLQKVFGAISQKIPEVFEFANDYQEKKNNIKVNSVNNEFYMEFSIDELSIKILKYSDFSCDVELKRLENEIECNSMELLQVLYGK